MNNKIHFTRLIAIFLFAAILGGHWDIWWHGTVGRESFWVPPHLMLYSGIAISVLLGLYGWWRFHEKAWRNAAFALVFVLLAGPFDELWHRLFGKEAIDSLLIIWSPPHLMIVAAFITGFAFLLPLIRKDPDENARRFMGAFMWAAIISLLSFLMRPFNPTGSFHVLGFWGSAFLAMAIVWPLLRSQKWLGGFAPVTLVSVILMAITSITFGGEISPDVLAIPHGDFPSFLVIFSYFSGALAMDLLIHKPRWIRGALYGLLWGGILFGFSSPFFEPIFHYSGLQAGQAIIAAVAGGLIAGLLP